MSNLSVTSSKQELASSDLVQELESIRSMNNSLRAYLAHLRMFRKNIKAMDTNFTKLKNVNSEWLELLNKN